MVQRRLRVAFVDYVLLPDAPGRSGLSDIVWDMASALVHQGHESHVIASYETTDYPDSRVVVHNFAPPPIGYRNLLGHFLILARAAGIAKRLRPDLIHAPEYLSTAVLSLLGVRFPLVVTVPGNVFHRIRYGHSYEWHYLQALKLAARISARRCRAIIAGSQEMKSWWERTGSSPDRTILLPLGVDPGRFYPAPNARQRLGVSANELYLLYVGRFAVEKGLFDLIDAVSRIRPLLASRNVRIALAGTGPLENELRERVGNLGLEDIVRVHGWIPQDHLSVWYSAADALLLPSLNEPFGRVIGESMACGTPVVASATGGPRELIRHEETGLLFPPRDVAALADLLGAVALAPEILRSMRAAALDYATTTLAWSQIMPRIIDEAYLPSLEGV